MGGATNYSSLEEQAAAQEASDIPPAQVKEPAAEAKAADETQCDDKASCDGCCCGGDK